MVFSDMVTVNGSLGEVKTEINFRGNSSKILRFLGYHLNGENGFM